MSKNVEAPKDGVSLREEWKWDGDLQLRIGSCYNLKEAESITKGSRKQCGQQGGEEDMFGQEEENGSDCTTEDIPSSVGKRTASGVNQIQRSGKVQAMTSRYKGVVPQPKGRWGAQIYEKHRRIWLGTFNTEQDAAHSYDTAALKFRGRKAITNFAPVEDTNHQEVLFLLRHSKAEIVDMLRKHTYHQELQQSYTKNNAADKRSTNSYGEFALESERATFGREHLFDKTVTPSDVGKLNRLVIPKHHAERCFPMDSARTDKVIMLNFQDCTGKTWRFRYSYWNSSQSYVLTKGWSCYVKEKELRTGDTVIFERSTGNCGELYISFCRRPCNIVPQNSIPIATFFRNPKFLPGYSRWTQTSVPVEDNRALIYREYIPWSDKVPFAFQSGFGSSIPVNSPSLNRKCNVLRYSNLSARTFTQSTSPVSSSVTVFGVNLSPSSSSTLNLFPSSSADNGGPSSFEAVQQ